MQPMRHDFLYPSKTELLFIQQKQGRIFGHLNEAENMVKCESMIFILSPIVTDIKTRRYLRQAVARAICGEPNGSSRDAEQQLQN